MLNLILYYTKYFALSGVEEKSITPFSSAHIERSFFMNDEKDTIEIDLLALAQAVWKRIWLVLTSVVAGAVAAFLFATFIITPLYESKAMLYVNNSSISVGSTSFSISTGELSAAQSLVKTYIVIMQSRQTLNAVIEQADLVYTYDELKDMISAASVNNTEIFEITVTSDDPEEAELIVNTISDILPDKIADIVEGSSVRVVDYGVVPVYPVSPNVTKFALVGFLLGGVLSVGFIILLELLNNSIRSEEYLIQTYDLPVLAVVPAMTRKSRRKKGSASQSKATMVGGNN